MLLCLSGAFSLENLSFPTGMQQRMANAAEAEGLNPWAQVLRTFLPWVNAGAAPDYTQDTQDQDTQDSDPHDEAAASDTQDAAGA